MFRRPVRQQCDALCRRRAAAEPRSFRLAARPSAARDCSAVLRPRHGGRITMYGFVSGSIMIGCFVASLFFYRFWRRTLDRLFIWFAVAFLILGAERLVLAIAHLSEMSSPAIYIMRLVAFALIIAAIVDKNRVLGR